MVYKMYLLDSNIYINFYDRYYKIDFFPTFWNKLAVILNAQVSIPKIVIEENYQDPWFKEWIKKYYKTPLIDHKLYSDEWAKVIRHIATCGLYKEAALSSEKGWAHERIADPWLIAIAKKDELTLVTDEIKNPNLNSLNPSKSAKIPDVCEQLGVRCISMNHFFKEVKLSV